VVGDRLHPKRFIAALPLHYHFPVVILWLVASFGDSPHLWMPRSGTVYSTRKIFLATLPLLCPFADFYFSVFKLVGGHQCAVFGPNSTRNCGDGAQSLQRGRVVLLGCRQVYNTESSYKWIRIRLSTGLEKHLCGLSLANGGLGCMLFSL